MTATAALVPVGRRRPSVDVAAGEDLADVCRIGDDLFAHRMQRDLVAASTTDLDRLGRRCEQVLDDLVVDLEVARPKKELLARIAPDVREDVLEARRTGSSAERRPRSPQEAPLTSMARGMMPGSLSDPVSVKVLPELQKKGCQSACQTTR